SGAPDRDGEMAGGRARPPDCLGAEPGRGVSASLRNEVLGADPGLSAGAPAPSPCSWGHQALSVVESAVSGLAVAIRGLSSSGGSLRWSLVRGGRRGALKTLLCCGVGALARRALPPE